MLRASSEEAFIESKLKVLLEVSLLPLAYRALGSLSQKQTSNSVPHHNMPDFVCHSGEKKNLLNPLVQEGSIHLSLLSNCFSPMFYTRSLTVLDGAAVFDLGKLRGRTNLQPPFFSGSMNMG